MGRVRHAWKMLLRLVVYAVVRPPVEVLRRMSPETSAAVGERFGGFLGAVLPRERRRMVRHLQRAFPDHAASDLDRVARGVFRHLGRTLGEYLSLTAREPSELVRRVQVEGFEHLLRAKSAGRGVIVLTAHLGSWEVAAAATGVALGGLAVVARDLYDERLTRMVDGWRRRFSVTVLDTRDARGMFKHLRAGGVLAILADQYSARVDNVPVEWFGHPALSPVGPVSLARRTGSAVLIAFTYREAGRHRVVFEPYADALNGSPDTEVVRAFNRRLEEHVRARPEQWVWMHDRWRSAS